MPKWYVLVSAGFHPWRAISSIRFVMSGCWDARMDFLSRIEKTASHLIKPFRLSGLGTKPCEYGLRLFHAAMVATHGLLYWRLFLNRLR